MKLISTTLAAAAVLFLSTALPSVTQERPLLMEGKRTLFQRIIMRPDASLHSAANGNKLRPTQAFEPFYVFERDGDWLKVGASPTREAEGWAKENKSVEWRQNIVVAFTNASGRNRQVMFESREKLEWLLNHQALATMQPELVRQADTRELEAESGVLAVEPTEYPNIRENFYLMPILDFAQDYHPMSLDPIINMEVASIPIDDTAQSLSDDFEVGVVFVIDTTQSMDPYIRMVRKGVETIISGILDLDADQASKIHFGALAFRDSPEAAPGLEYRTKWISRIERDRSHEAFLLNLANTHASTYSSDGFNEDSLAGVLEAVRNAGWDADGSPIGAKFVILITDAGPKRPGDPNAGSPIKPTDLQKIAEDNGVGIITMHLATPNGVANHAVAAAAYQGLSSFDQNPAYHAIPNGDPQVFNTEIERLTQTLADEIRIARGEAVEPQEGEAANSARNLGHAMRLRFLGAQRQTNAPDVLRTWVSNRAVDTPQKEAFEPRLLLTKAQLSTMYTTIEEVLRVAESAQRGDANQEFFRRVKGVVTRVARNPDQVVDVEFETLGGAFGEFLEGLPYESPLMQITEERWINAGTERREIIDQLRSKLQTYKIIHDDPSNWTKLSQAASEDEHVYAMPFALLP